MGPAQRPLHLLFFDESPSDHLIDRRLHKCRANRFPLSSTLAEVRNELTVIADVCSKVIEAVDDLLRSVRGCDRMFAIDRQADQPLPLKRPWSNSHRLRFADARWADAAHIPIAAGDTVGVRQSSCPTSQVLTSDSLTGKFTGFSHRRAQVPKHASED